MSGSVISSRGRLFAFFTWPSANSAGFLTPGHTLESTCYLLSDGNGQPHCIFTGDTLFVGDVGRPDLAQKGEEITMNDLAGMLYDSLRSKIMPLAER